MSWEYNLNIINKTDRDIEVMSSELISGYWMTNDIEDKKPVKIKAHSESEALTIKAHFGPNGYEFKCTWKDTTTTGQKSYGTISLEINVPYTVDNYSKCTTSGAFIVSGWSELPASGHNFIQTMVVSVDKSKL